MDESLVLARHLGRVQQRMTHAVGAMAARIEKLEQEVVRLRAQCVLARTAWAWGLPGWGGGGWPRRPSAPQRPGAKHAVSPWREAEQVVCQTGCVGHAHVWLQDDGSCRRHGAPCERLVKHEMTVTANVSAA